LSEIDKRSARQNHSATGTSAKKVRCYSLTKENKIELSDKTHQHWIIILTRHQRSSNHLEMYLKLFFNHLIYYKCYRLLNQSWRHSLFFPWPWSPILLYLEHPWTKSGLNLKRVCISKIETSDAINTFFSTDPPKRVQLTIGRNPPLGHLQRESGQYWEAQCQERSRRSHLYQ
jgi:hypothetical protein